MNITNLISGLILAAQIAIAVISYFKVYRHRVIYSLSTAVLRMPDGTASDTNALDTEHINKKLGSGKYTVLQVVERTVDHDMEIILGQIKN